MALSVVDLVGTILPRTNCRDCGFPTCVAFAGMVVADKIPLSRCPHIPERVLSSAQAELDAQHAAGKWTRRDMAQDALVWARQRAASMELSDLAQRIGGRLVPGDDGQYLELDYFRTAVAIAPEGLRRCDGKPLDRWEQVFLYNHMAQGGRAAPTGRWVAFEQLPNTVSKIKSMRAHVEQPLQERFSGRVTLLAAAAEALGGAPAAIAEGRADLSWRFHALPRIPLLLLFWDAMPADGFAARAKLLFDETITQHVDIESILFLCEHLAARLCGGGG
jgi:hypothetical protein